MPASWPRYPASAAPRSSSRRWRVSSQKQGGLPDESGKLSSFVVEHDLLESDPSAGKPAAVSSSELVELHVIPAEYSASPANRV